MLDLMFGARLREMDSETLYCSIGRGLHPFEFWRDRKQIVINPHATPPLCLMIDLEQIQSIDVGGQEHLFYRGKLDLSGLH